MRRKVVTVTKGSAGRELAWLGVGGCCRFLEEDEFVCDDDGARWLVFDDSLDSQYIKPILLSRDSNVERQSIFG